jgi:Swi5-dependent recombination DNA repair protein 1
MATPLRQRKVPSTTTVAPKPKASPTLAREIISLRSDIQILSQALSLSNSTKDADLQILVDRWRVASRAAAEELFAGTRDRVNSMGGVGAWKSREREQAEWRGKWEKEEQEAEAERRREKIEELREEGKLGEDYEERIEERAEERNGEGEKAEEEEGRGKDDDVSFLIADCGMRDKCGLMNNSLSQWT